MSLYIEDRTELTVIFDRRVPEQREALDYFRAGFAEAASLEAVSEHIFCLHISPGMVRRVREGDGE